MREKEEYLNLSHINISAVEEEIFLSITLTGLLNGPYLAESAPIYHSQARWLLPSRGGADAGTIAGRPDGKAPRQGLCPSASLLHARRCIYRDQLPSGGNSQERSAVPLKCTLLFMKDMKL